MERVGGRRGMIPRPGAARGHRRAVPGGVARSPLTRGARRRRGPAWGPPPWRPRRGAGPPLSAAAAAGPGAPAAVRAAPLAPGARRPAPAAALVALIVVPARQHVHREAALAGAGRLLDVEPNPRAVLQPVDLGLAPQLRVLDAIGVQKQIAYVLVALHLHEPESFGVAPACLREIPVGDGASVLPGHRSSTNCVGCGESSCRPLLRGPRAAGGSPASAPAPP